MEVEKEINKLKYELQVTKEALAMKHPLYWEDYSRLSNSTRWNMQDHRTEKMSEGFELELFLEEEGDEVQHALARAIATSYNHSNELLSDEKLVIFIKHLIDTENVSALKEFDEDYVRDLLELDKDYQAQFDKLTSKN